jgi:hypothetical protein
MQGRADYNAGTILDDDQIHAVKQLGMTKYALCGLGRIRHTLPTPFVPGAEGSCWECAERANER